MLIGSHLKRYTRPLLAAGALLLLLGALPAAAENLGPGGGTRIIIGDQVVGPYRVLFLASPEPAIVGTITFVVRLSNAATGERVKDAGVTIVLTRAEGGEVVRAEATHEAAGNLMDYAAHISFNQAGSWNGVLTIDGPAGAAETTFLQRISPPRSVTTLVAVGLPFAVLLAALGFVWVIRSRRAVAAQEQKG